MYAYQHITNLLGIPESTFNVEILFNKLSQLKNNGRIIFEKNIDLGNTLLIEINILYSEEEIEKENIYKKPIEIEKSTKHHCFNFESDFNGNISLKSKGYGYSFFQDRKEFINSHIDELML